MSSARGMHPLARRALKSLRPTVGLRWNTHSGAAAGVPEGGKLVGAGIGRMSNMIMDRGEGSWVWCNNGEKYLDFSCGIGVTNLGHCHPKVKAAVSAQLDKVWHAQVNIVFHQPMLTLVEKLKEVMPAGSGLDTFLFVTSGSEAVEAAVKLARHATGKPNIIVMQGGYHGRTLLTASMTTSKTIFSGGYGPHCAGIHVTPHPYYQVEGVTLDDPTKWALHQLELLTVMQTAPNETAALVIEPVLGEGGYVPHPPGLLEGIRKFCDKHDILFIADEVQTGFGRTGKMFAVEHDPVKPDVLIFAKGIANGMPLAGIASRKELMDRQPGGSQGGTYAGNALACASANATIDALRDENILENVNARGKELRAGLEAMQQEGLAPIHQVRGPGLMIGLDFDMAKVERGFAGKVSKACLERGMIVLTTGALETLRLIPPLNVSPEEVQICLKTLREAFHAVSQ